jgi:hypothetical protein
MLSIPKASGVIRCLKTPAVAFHAGIVCMMNLSSGCRHPERQKIPSTFNFSEPVYCRAKMSCVYPIVTISQAFRLIFSRLRQNVLISLLCYKEIERAVYTERSSSFLYSGDRVILRILQSRSTVLSPLMHT